MEQVIIIKMEKQKIIYISAFLILTSLAGAGIYNLDTGEFDDLTSVWYCEAADISKNCDSLSTPNQDTGYISRCYFFSEELNRTTYKICSSGWNKVVDPVEEIANNNLEAYYFLERKRDFID